PTGVNRLAYSTTNADTYPVNTSTTTNLTIGWDVCSGVDVAHGCSLLNAVRKLPVGAGGRPVVKIVSSGEVRRSDQSTVASRKLTVWATDCEPKLNPGNGSI